MCYSHRDGILIDMKDWELAVTRADQINELALEYYPRLLQAEDNRNLIAIILFCAAVMDEDMRRVDKWLFQSDQQSIHELKSILIWRENELNQISPGFTTDLLNHPFFQKAAQQEWSKVHRRGMQVQLCLEKYEKVMVYQHESNFTTA